MRVQVNLSDDVANKLDFYCKRMGMNRSALCSYFIGHGLLVTDKSMDIISGMGNAQISGDDLMTKALEVFKE